MYARTERAVSGACTPDRNLPQQGGTLHFNLDALLRFDELIVGEVVVR